MFFESNQLIRNTFISGELQKKNKKKKNGREHCLSYTSANTEFLAAII